MLKPVVSTCTAHAITAPAAIRMRLTPRPICRPPGDSWEARGSSAARDGDELEVVADLPEQPLEPGHERRLAQLAGGSAGAEPRRAKHERFADLLEFVHAASI